MITVSWNVPAPFLVNAQHASLLPEEQQLLAVATHKLIASETANAANGVAWN